MRIDRKILRENSYPNTADQRNSANNNLLTNIKQHGSNTNKLVWSYHNFVRSILS